MASRLFLRNLAKRGKSITLQNRAITSPVFGAVDFNETFTTASTVKALVKTTSGKTFFDGVSVDRVITHIFRIEYLAGVTAETWILFNSRRIDILQVENCCEEDSVLILTCSDIGVGEAAKA